MNKLPRLSDDKALTDWVGRHLPEPFHDWLVMPWHRWWGHGFTEPDREGEAVAAARQGNFKLLGTLMQQGVRLGAEAQALMADRLLGIKTKGKGRPKQTEAQRRVSNPVHGAAKEVTPIEDLLREHFWGQTGYHDRAIDIAAYRAGIDRERLAKHLQSPHKLVNPS